MTGCGGGVVNEGTPTGTLIATGTLNGIGGVSAGATISLYSQGAGSYAVQIAGLTYSGSACSSTSVGVVAGSYVSGSLLQGTGGSFNYYFHALSSQPSAIILYCTGASPISSQVQAQTGTLNPA